MKRTLFALSLVACSGAGSEGPDTLSQPLETVLLGNARTETLTDSAAAGVAEAFRYVAPSKGAATRIRIYVDGANTAKSAFVGIYDDAGGQPGKPLTRAGFTPRSGWNEVAMPPVQIAAGKSYWIAMLGPVGGGKLQLRARDTGNATFGSTTTAQTNLSALPDTWAPSERWPGWTVSAYALSVTDGSGGGGGGGASSAGAPGAGAPSAGAPSAGAPSAGAPSAGAPSAGAPSAGAPSAGAPSAGAPSAGAPSAGAPSAGAPSAGSSAGGASNGPPPTGKVLFEDTFDGSQWPGAWFLQDRKGDLGNSEVGCYQRDNLSVSGGLLRIQTEADTSCAGYSYTSGAIQWKSFAFTYGTVEVRAKLAGGEGPWPAIWLLGSDCQVSNQTTADNVGGCNWPNSGSDEIDIAERLGYDRTTVNQQIHSSLGKPGCRVPTSDVSQNFHTYGLVWAPGSVRWTIDGVTTCVVTDAAVPSRPMFLIINTAVGGVGGGAVNPSTIPQSSYIDYVTVRQ